MKNLKRGLSAVLFLAADAAWISRSNQILLIKGPGSFNKNLKIGANVDETETYIDMVLYHSWRTSFAIRRAFKQVFS